MPTPPKDKADAEILTKGVICALIGAVILLRPYVARSADVRELMLQMRLVGWFALVLGLAFIGRGGYRRYTRRGD